MTGRRAPMAEDKPQPTSYFLFLDARGRTPFQWQSPQPVPPRFSKYLWWYSSAS